MKPTTPLRLLLSFLAATLLFTTDANATLVSYSFAGFLSNVTDQSELLSGRFSAGNTFQGMFTYETSVQEGPTNFSDPTAVASYPAIMKFRVNINGYEIEGSPPTWLRELVIWDDKVIGSSVVDAFTVTSDYTPLISGMGSGTVIASAIVFLLDYTHTASLLGTQIPTSVDLTRYGSSSFTAAQVNVDTGQAFYLNGTVTSLTPIQTTVPPPHAAWLLGSGLIGLGGVARKRKVA